jgi:G3E family GTPase
MDMNDADAGSSPGLLPVTIITGFLGSGKTTLLNHILKNQQGIRTAVLVNEFGEIGIDNELIVSTDADMVELANGCICCSINDDLVRTVGKLLERRESIDYLVVETTGVADPMPVAMSFVGRALSPHVRLDAIVTLVDAENFSVGEIESAVPYNQVKYGDIILLNKCDLVSETRLSELVTRIREIKPCARITRTDHAQVALPLILDVDLFHQAEEPARDHGSGHAHHTGNHLQRDGFTSLSFESSKPFDIHRLQHFLSEQLPQTAFRAKGILWFDTSPARHVFHLTGRRFTMDETTWGDRPKGNKLVIIGQHLIADRLTRQLAECVVA